MMVCPFKCSSYLFLDVYLSDRFALILEIKFAIAGSKQIFANKGFNCACVPFSAFAAHVTTMIYCDKFSLPKNTGNHYNTSANQTFNIYIQNV